MIRYAPFSVSRLTKPICFDLPSDYQEQHGHATSSSATSNNTTSSSANAAAAASIVVVDSVRECAVVCHARDRPKVASVLAYDTINRLYISELSIVLAAYNADIIGTYWHATTCLFWLATYRKIESR